MAQTRKQVLALLEQETPDVEQAIALLKTTRESDFTPDALTLRAVILEAVERIECGKARPFDLAAFLKDAANGHFVEMEEHDIEFDLHEPQEEPDATPLSVLFGGPKPGVPPMPGPDAAFIDTLRQREAIVARRIAGQSPSVEDIDAYQQSLTALARALQPLLQHDPSPLPSTL